MLMTRSGPHREVRLRCPCPPCTTTPSPSAEGAKGGRGAHLVSRLRPHAMLVGPRLAQRRHQVGELAEERSRVARVDHLLDPEGLRRAERRAELLEALVDPGEPGPLIPRRVH